MEAMTDDPKVGRFGRLIVPETIEATEEPSLWRTSDMALVAYLTTLGRQSLHMELDRDVHPVSCYWVYEETEDLGGDVLGFLEGSGTVEPRAFNNIMFQLKNAMFEFLRANGISTNRR